MKTPISIPPSPSPPRRGRLAADLKRLDALAFGKVSNCRDFVERFHALPASARKHPDYRCLEKLYAWMFVPFSSWPVDLRGFGLYVWECVADGRPLDPAARLKCGYLPDAPPEDVCRTVSEHEQSVSAGSYESLIESQHKFNSIEQELADNAELKADWDGIKGVFKVSNFQNSKGIIRRRMVQERNFRPTDWKCSWQTATDAQQFQNCFDAFCHKWNLYGMEGDKPLLLKLTVNMTPHGMIMMVPRYWSFDPHRDLKWKEITRLHRARNTHPQKQGPKLSANEAARREEVER